MQDFENIGASNILSYKYNYSIFQLVSEMYPQVEWLPWRFAKTSKNYWNNAKSQQQFMDWAGKQLNIKELDDWHRVSIQVTMETKYS
jgi:hypothetical protein